MAYTTSAPKAMSGNVKTSSSTKSKVQSMYAKNIKTGQNKPVFKNKPSNPTSKTSRLTGASY